MAQLVEYNLAKVGVAGSSPVYRFFMPVKRRAFLLSLLNNKEKHCIIKFRGDCMSQIEKLQQLIDDSKRIVFFGGAGVSTESGIPDFRSTDGLYHQQYAYPPETILSHTFFM